MNTLKRIRVGLRFGLFGLALVAQGCGYGWSDRGNPWAKDGVSSVYVRAIINNSPHAGVEIPVMAALLKQFVQGKRIRMVNSEAEADSVLQGTISDFHSDISASNQVPAVAQPNDTTVQALSDQIIATEYRASATVSVVLTRKRDGKSLWAQSFSRGKTYPAGNRYGLIGTTSELIDASQERLALNDISDFIASDIYDTMLEAF